MVVLKGIEECGKCLMVVLMSFAPLPGPTSLDMLSYVAHATRSWAKYQSYQWQSDSQSLTGQH